jgi:hypothetical protein
MAPLDQHLEFLHLPTETSLVLKIRCELIGPGGGRQAPEALRRC